MRRLLVLLAFCLSLLAAGASPAGATSECNGLPACVRVPGPWVVVPATSPPAGRQSVEYQLACPKHFIVGGLDAELSDRGIDLRFLGILGGPVNPGITTAANVVFVASQTGTSGRAASFHPVIGCMPAGRGAGTPPTVFGVARAPAAAHVATAPALRSARPDFAPGQPTVRHVQQYALHASSTRRLTVSCARGERLLQGARAVAFYGRRPPAAALVQAVSTALAVDASRVSVTVRTGAAIAKARAVVQLQAVCAGTS